MKAMVLAAGLGTRLRPLTDHRPKALVEVGGRTMLEITLLRLREFGVGEVIVNTHHFADMMAAYLRANRNFGMRVEISHEQDLLDTGGGLKKASWFFREDKANQHEPFILHNVDVISTIDFARMIRFHNEQGALATLAMRERVTSRPLLFDESGQFLGRASRTTGTAKDGSPAEGRVGSTPERVSTPEVHALAFSGIHIVSPRIFDEMDEEGAFSIIDTYVRLAAQGEKIVAFRADDYYWRDLGRPENVIQAAQDLAGGGCSVA